MAALLPVLLTHLLLLCAHGATASAAATPPPLPVLPIPSYAQLRWQLSEMALFLHFGPNTFTDSEWGTGHADPSVFAPSALDAGQWARVAARGGFGRVVLTAKHHDGFCLWPSALTNYSVAPRRGGPAPGTSSPSSPPPRAPRGSGWGCTSRRGTATSRCTGTPSRTMSTTWAR